MAILLYDLVGADESRPFSPHCWKAKMALAHKGLEWRDVPTPFTEVAGIEGEGATVPKLKDGERVVCDSFEIALYLEEAYPDRPSLFKGEGGKAAARFVESWATSELHAVLGKAAVMDIHERLAPADREHLRKTRKVRFGMEIEEAEKIGREQMVTIAQRLQPLRAMLARQPFIGGESPLFSDYIVFGGLQWARIVSATNSSSPACSARSLALFASWSGRPEVCVIRCRRVTCSRPSPANAGR